MEQKTRIQIERKTRSRLAKYGNMSSTWDSIINEFLNHADKCDIFWSDRT